MTVEQPPKPTPAASTPGELNIEPFDREHVPALSEATVPARPRRGGRHVKPSAQPVKKAPAEAPVEVDPELAAALASFGQEPAPGTTPTVPPGEAPAEVTEPAEPPTVDPDFIGVEEPPVSTEVPTSSSGGLLGWAGKRLATFSRRRTQPAEPPIADEPASAEGGQPAVGEASTEAPAEPPAPTETPQVTPGEPAGVEEDQATETVASQAESPIEPLQPADRETIEATRREGIIDRIARRLENIRVFGRSLPEHAFRGIGLGGVRWGAKELAKGIVSWSGVAGAVGGGVAGTALTGAFVGAFTGAAVEYIRQVNTNLSTRVEATPGLNSRKAIFLQKLKEARHGEVYTQNIDRGKVAKAAMFGALMGAGAGAIADIPVVREFLNEHVRRFLPNFGGVGQAASEAVKSVGSAASAAGRTIGQIPGAEGLGEAAGAAGRTVGDLAGAVGRTGGDIGHAVEEMAGEVGRLVNIGGAQDATKEVAATGEAPPALATEASTEAPTAVAEPAEAIATPPGTGAEPVTAQPALTDYVPRADFDNLQRQLDDAKAALAAARGVTSGVLPSTEQAAVAIGSAAEQAAATATEAAQNQLSEAFAKLELGDNYALHPGDSVAGITEKLGKSLGLTNAQAWELGRRLAVGNGVTSQYYGTTGNVLDRNLPIGKVMNMQGVKSLALEMLKDKNKLS